MANAFGFTRPGEQPSPDPRQVGQELSQPKPRRELFEVDPIDTRPARREPDIRVAFEAPARTREAGFRREGGKLMGSGGDDFDGAMSAAVGEALTRAGGGHTPNPNPFKNRDRNVAELKRFMSPFEAELLRETV